MTIFYKWSLYCNDESAVHEVGAIEGTTPPLVCPVNAAHACNPDSLQLIPSSRTGDVSTVSIRQNDDTVDGRFVSFSHNFVAYGPPGHETIFQYHYNVNTSISLGEFIYEEDQEGDEVSIVIAPRTTVGVLLSTASNGDLTVTCSPTVALNVHKHVYLTLTNGAVTSNEVEITAINSATNVITFKPALVLSSSLNAYTTYVQMSYYMVDHRILGPAGHIEVGATILGGSSIPANIPIEIRYKTNSNEPWIAKILADVAIGDTTVTVSRTFEKHMITKRNYFKLTNGTTTSNELQFINFDDSGDNLIVHFTPAIDSAFLIGDKIRKTATKPICLACEGQT